MGGILIDVIGRFIRYIKYDLSRGFVRDIKLFGSPFFI